MDEPQTLQHVALHLAKYAGEVAAIAEHLDHEGDPVKQAKARELAERFYPARLDALDWCRQQIEVVFETRIGWTRCEWCQKRRAMHRANQPPNYLPTLLCSKCLDSHEAVEAGWREMCRPCGGTGRYDDVMECDSCEGEGVVLDA